MGKVEFRITLRLNTTNLLSVCRKHIFNIMNPIYQILILGPIFYFLFQTNLLSNDEILKTCGIKNRVLKMFFLFFVYKIILLYLGFCKKSLMANEWSGVRSTSEIHHLWAIFCGPHVCPSVDLPTFLDQVIKYSYLLNVSPMDGLLHNSQKGFVISIKWDLLGDVTKKIIITINYKNIKNVQLYILLFNMFL